MNTIGSDIKGTPLVREKGGLLENHSETKEFTLGNDYSPLKKDQKALNVTNLNKLP
jgi:hypothetical protein